MEHMGNETVNNHAAFIWSVADLLRGDYKQSEYGKVILPLTVIRRLDAVLAPTKAKVLERHAQLAGKLDNVDPVLTSVSGEQFYNTSKLDLPRLLDDPVQHDFRPLWLVGGMWSMWRNLARQLLHIAHRLSPACSARRCGRT